MITPITSMKERDKMFFEIFMVPKFKAALEKMKVFHTTIEHTTESTKKFNEALLTEERK